VAQIPTFVCVAQICDQEKFAAICKELIHDSKHAICTINVAKTKQFHHEFRKISTMGHHYASRTSASYHQLAWHNPKISQKKKKN
jgi:hypothetical protein